MVHSSPSVTIRQTTRFRQWFAELRDRTARARILARIDRLAFGNPGDVKSVGGGVLELRIDHGPGYRVYLIRRGERLIILLSGGDKSTQDRDIRAARDLADQIGDVP